MFLFLHRALWTPALAADGVTQSALHLACVWKFSVDFSFIIVISARVQQCRVVRHLHCARSLLDLQSNRISVAFDPICICTSIEPVLLSFFAFCWLKFKNFLLSSLLVSFFFSLFALLLQQVATHANSQLSMWAESIRLHFAVNRAGLYAMPCAANCWTWPSHLNSN